MIEQPIDHTIRTVGGDSFSLKVYRGMPLLIVNTACGDQTHSHQFSELETLYERYAPRGFEIVAIPCDDFGNEFSTDAEVASFLSLHYSLSFQIGSLSRCTGADQSRVFRSLSSFSGPATRGPILGSFTKFLVDADGYAVDRFAPAVSPLDPSLLAALVCALPTNK
jgi:glutathione peroxidase